MRKTIKIITQDEYNINKNNERLLINYINNKTYLSWDDLYRVVEWTKNIKIENIEIFFKGIFKNDFMLGHTHEQNILKYAKKINKFYKDNYKIV